MPEGHVTHRLALELTRAFAGSPVRVSSPQGRFADATALLDGTKLVGSDAVGKHLFVDFEAAQTIWIHLGLIGKMTLLPASDPIKNAETLRLRIELLNDDETSSISPLTVKGDAVVPIRTATKQPADPITGPLAAELRGPQWCRLITSDERAEVIAKSGPDPLRDDADPQRAWAKLQRTSKAIGQLLMDQNAFAGVGNIFRAEVLFRHGVDPQLPANQLPRAVFDSMWQDLAQLMRIAVEIGRIDSVHPQHMPDAMGREPRVDAHGGEVYVYRRADQPCLVCGTDVQMAPMAGRNLYWCPICQPRGAAGRPLSEAAPDQRTAKGKARGRNA